MKKYVNVEDIPFHYLPIAAIGDLYVTKKEILSMPAADVREIRHGSWVYGDNDIPHCSECGCEPARISAFCPDCGANMEDGE